MHHVNCVVQTDPGLGNGCGMTKDYKVLNGLGQVATKNYC